MKHDQLITMLLSQKQWTPMQIVGIRAVWDTFDVSKLFQDDAYTTPATAIGNVVGGWKDRTIWGNHITQPTAGNKPALAAGPNGKLCVHFTKANANYLASALVNTIPKIAPIHYYAVVKVTTAAPANNNRIIAPKNPSAIGIKFGQATNFGWAYATKQGVGNITGVMPFYSSTQFQLVEFIYAADRSTTTYWNGAKRDYLAPSTSPGSGDTVFIIGGSTVSSEYFDGDIVALCVSDTDISIGDRIRLENYYLNNCAIVRPPVLNVPSPQTIPCYTGTDCVHPDVIDFGATPWNGWRYWMAFTPYPPAANENPSIVVSNDGNTWQVPVGLTNPIVANPGGGAFNTDPSIVMSADGVTMYLVWMEWKAANYNKIYLKSSTDGVTWGDSALLVDAAVNAAMSPSVLWDGTQFVMYSCNYVPTPHVIERRVCATIDGTWGEAAAITWANPFGVVPKHVDVILSGSVYYLIFMDVDSGINSGLYFGQGANGIAFTADPNFRIPGQVGVWDYEPYRACLVPAGDGLDIWYSGMTNGETAGKIGRTHYTLPV